MSKRFAVFASGSGTNFQKIAEEVQNGKIDGEIGILFCDRQDAFAIDRANALGIPNFVLIQKNYPSKKEFETAILSRLQEEKIDFIVLAGYMRFIGETLLQAYPDKILNIHPAYLPNFPGAHGIQDAFEAKVKESGVTVHLVDEGVDTGRILEQVKVPIHSTDTLESFEERIHQTEYHLYPKVIQKFILQNKE